MPPDLNQTFSAVRMTLADCMQTMTQLGLPLGSIDLTPNKALEEFRRLDKEGNFEQIAKDLVPKVPFVLQAKVALEEARHDLELAELNLRYCDIASEIDGVVTGRNVNPGNNVQAGQALMAVRSLTEIWIDANFKETQLADLRIGQRVRCEVDMYGSRQEFEGRITGFTMGTGQTLSLLPPQNATGNFVKIVQRLPVRIELTDYDPDKAPLFVGLSVTPYVYYKEPPTGPHAGEILQPLAALPTSSHGPPTMSPKELPSPRRRTGLGGRIMSSMALSPTAVSRPAVNPWIVAGVVVVPTFMEVLDTTIANVALRYIAGGLSAAQSDAEWVITSYLAANAIVLPITGWLSAHLGRRNYFLLSIAVFTLASAMCGFATSLPQMILFRVIQGLSGGGLQPCSQGILMDTFPPEKQGTAMTLFGLAAMHRADRRADAGRLALRRLQLAVDLPASTSRWALVALVGAYAVVDDPDYLKQERAEFRGKPLNFDSIGLGLLVLVMCCWEIVLSKGQEWDWLGDPFWRVQTLLILFVLGLGLLIFREMRTAQPDHRLPGPRRAELRRVLRHHLLRLRRGVLRQASRCRSLLQALFGYDALRLRAGDVPVGRLLDGRDGGRRHPAGPAV